jgi:peptide methionine sulfoxide reductase msrA/msrB
MRTVSSRLAPLAFAACISLVAPALHASDDKPSKPSKENPVKVEDLSKLSDAELRAKLTPEQFRICKECGTEPPFKNAFWDNHQPGIYVDVISGEPLFASVHKFDSGTGWPSFWQPIKKDSVAEHKDTAYGMIRTEVKAAKSGAHLGHVFEDGPKDKTGLRYCINSASLKFIPKDKLDESGLGEYKKLFTEDAKK